MLGDTGDSWSPAHSRARQRVPTMPTPTVEVPEDLPELEEPADVYEDVSKDVADVPVDGEKKGGLRFISYLLLGLVRLCGIQALKVSPQSRRYRMARDDLIAFGSRVRLVSFFMSIMD